MESIWPLEIRWTLALQSLGDVLLLPMRLVTFLGDEEFYMLVMPALYWCVDALLGLRIGLMLVLSGTLNGAAKLLFKSPRPCWLDARVTAHISESTFGMPSGHAMNAASVGAIRCQHKKEGAQGYRCGAHPADRLLARSPRCPFHLRCARRMAAGRTAALDRSSLGTACDPLGQNAAPMAPGADRLPSLADSHRLPYTHPAGDYRLAVPRRVADSRGDHRPIRCDRPTLTGRRHQRRVGVLRPVGRCSMAVVARRL